MPIGLPTGSVHLMTGYCTHAFLLRAKTGAELEAMLGYRRGRLAKGFSILFLETLPDPDGFQLAGYTYFSDGARGGHRLTKEDREPVRMESLLKSEHGWSDAEIRAKKRGMVGTKIKITGHERLAKVIPASDHVAGEEYPPGLGVFQVKIVRPLRFRVKANVAAGACWFGDYA